MPMPPRTTMAAIVSQPGVPHSTARKVNNAGAQTEPRVPPTWVAPWYSARRRDSDSSEVRPQWPADWNSSAPVTVTWPNQTSAIVTQPTVSWVTIPTTHDNPMTPVLIRAARSAPLTVSAPRDAGTCSSTASTVLVPNSHASNPRGASVSCTSHNGMTTLS